MSPAVSAHNGSQSAGDETVAWLSEGASKAPARHRPIDLPMRLAAIALVAGSALLTWYIVRPGAANVDLSDLAFAAALALLLGRGRLRGMPFGNLTALWVAGFAMMQGGLLVGTLINGDPLRWLAIFAQYLFAYLLLPTLLGSTPRRLAWQCLLAFVLGVVLSQAFTLVTSLFFGYEQTWPWFGRDFLTATGRVGAFSGNANTNGGMIAFALPMLALAIGRGLLARWQGAICAAILVAGLVSTASFSAFSTAVIGLAVCALFVNPARFFLVVLPLALLLASYIQMDFPLPEAFHKRVGEALVSGDLNNAGTYAGRMELLKEAWAMADRTLLIGLGADQFRAVSIHAAPVHVFPVLILVEGGLVALAGLVTMVGVLFGRALEAMRFDRFGGAVALAVICDYVSLSFTAPHMYSRLWIGPIFLVLAAVWAPPDHARPAPARPPLAQRRKAR